MKQLTKHIMHVYFFEPERRAFNHSHCRRVDCADAFESRILGREIAEWMARGVGYRVESETLEIERK